MAAGGETQYLFKVLVVGEIGTGKTSLIKRYVHSIFSENYKSTIGVDFALKKIKDLAPNSLIRLQLWDIAGQERFGNMTRVYYKEAHGAFIVFDVTRDETFDLAQRWKNDIDNKVTLPNGDPIPVVLLANKCDMAGLSRNSEELTRYCQENGFATWFETSAKNGTNVDEAVNFLSLRMLDNHSQENSGGGEEDDLVRPGLADPAAKKSDGGCC